MIKYILLLLFLTAKANASNPLTTVASVVNAGTGIYTAVKTNEISNKIEQNNKATQKAQKVANNKKSKIWECVCAEQHICQIKSSNSKTIVTYSSRQSYCTTLYLLSTNEDVIIKITDNNIKYPECKLIN